MNSCVNGPCYVCSTPWREIERLRNAQKAQAKLSPSHQHYQPRKVRLLNSQWEHINNNASKGEANAIIERAKYRMTSEAVSDLSHHSRMGASVRMGVSGINKKKERKRQNVTHM